MIEELAGINNDVCGARRGGVAQKDRGVAPPVRVPWLSRLGANGANLGGVREAADARDALAGARAQEDELRLQLLALLRRRGARNRAANGRRTGAGEGARGSEARDEAKPRRGRGRGGSEARRGGGGEAGERARDARCQRRHVRGLRAQERRSDRTRSGAGHGRRRRRR